MSTTWKNSFSTGIREIDSQHMELFAQLDKLEVAVQNGKGSKEIVEIFRFLGNYVRRHFQAEEKLQKLYHYPHLELHVNEHAIFIKRLMELESTLHREGPTEKLATQTNAFLTQWLVNHVTNVDTKLADYFNEARTKKWELWLENNF